VPRPQGFTLLELMLVVAVLGIASIYMLESLTAETQQSMRAVADLIERDIRGSGMMIPQSAAVCIIDNTNGPDLLYVSDAEAIDPGDDIFPYDGALLPSSTTNVSGSSMSVSLSSLVLEPSPPARPAYDSDGDGAADSDFRDGGGVIVVDLNSPGRGVACGKITAVDTAGPGITFALASAPLANAVGPTRLAAIPAHEYRIENANELKRDGLLLAKGVEDLQVALFLDANDDNVVDAGEMRGVSGAPFASQGTDMRPLREVRVNLVARTRDQDREFDGKLQTRENRTAGADDGFRRRVYTSTIVLRNMFPRVGA
jgi:prepilin-type N-terminal cleavage/methylation domain-containing protein